MYLSTCTRYNELCDVNWGPIDSNVENASSMYMYAYAAFTTYFCCVQTSSIPVYERMWSFMQSAEPSVFVNGNNEGIKRVRDSSGRYDCAVGNTPPSLRVICTCMYTVRVTSSLCCLHGARQ